MAMVNSKATMLECLATLISRVGSITRLVEKSVTSNKEPQEWFSCLVDLLHELSNHLSQLRTATHVAEWPQYPTGKSISQDYWAQQLNGAVSEIKDVLDHEFAYLGSEIRNIRVVRPCGRSVDIVGRDEPILKLNVLLEKLAGLEKLSEERIFGLDVREDEQIEISSDQVKIYEIVASSSSTGVRKLEEQQVFVLYRSYPVAVNDHQRAFEMSHNPLPDYSKIVGFLQDTRVLQKAYQEWTETELNSKKHVLTDGICSPEVAAGSDIGSARERLHKAAELVLCWDPFDLENSDTFREYANALHHIMLCSLHMYPENLICHARNIQTAAISRLEGMISCLINANAALHNVEQIFESSRQQSHWFCSNTSVSLSLSSSHIPYRERDDVYGSSYYYSSSTSYDRASESSGSVIGSQIRPINEIEEEEEWDGLILHRFLHMISEITGLAGYSHLKNQFETKNTFQTAFAQFLINTIQSTGFQEVYDSRMQPKVDFKIMKLSELRERRNKWEQAFKVAVLVVLPWQKCLCETLFFQVPEYTRKCFHQVAEVCVSKLLNFASAAAYAMPGKIDRVFHLLYIYEVVDRLSANIRMVFLGAKQSYIPREMTDTLSILKNQISTALNDFMNQLQTDTYCHNSSFGKIESTSKDVDVHLVTKNVMLYLKDLSIYREILDSSILIIETMGSSHNTITTTVGQQALTLITCLKSNLEKKSSLLKNSNARHVFWINNLNHIVQEANAPNLRTLVAKEWVQEQQTKIDWHLIIYTESITAKALSSLWMNSIKNAMKSFKLAIEEICNIQASWKVPDPILRANLRDAVSKRVLMAYTQFLETHKHKLDSKFFMKNSVYTTEDLKFSLQGIFEGSDK